MKDAVHKAIEVEAVGMTMRFGGFTALDDVSIKVPAGSFHALFGENGAGKSTLVKCMMGFYRPTAGQMMVQAREQVIDSPRVASALGLGMVYQHITLVPSLSGAENLVISRSDTAQIIEWDKERAALAAFMQTMVPLDVPVAILAAGEKQKLEIIKQLYLGRHFIVLETSVLTPGEAEEVLGHVRRMIDRGELTVLMISHKFNDVMSFADDVTVLREGRRAGGGKVSALDRQAIATMMIGDQKIATLDVRLPVVPDAPEVLTATGIRAQDRSGAEVDHHRRAHGACRRDRRHLRHFRQRPEGIPRGVRGPAPPRRRRDNCQGRAV